MSSVTIISFLVFRHMQYMKINIFSEHLWLVLLSQRDLSRLHAKRELQLSATVLPVKVTTRSVLNLVSQHLLRISRSLLLGEMTNGTWIPVNPRLNTAVHMVSTFLLLQTAAIAVTETSGTSAMRDLNLKILQMHQTMIIFSCLVLHLRKLLTRVRSLQWHLKRVFQSQ